MPDACCSLPPVKSEYAPQGSVVEVGGIEVYSVGPSDAKAAIVGIYDIFGFHNNTKQFCDLVASATHARVLLPDFFRGAPWTAEKLETHDRSELLKWIGTEGSWEKIQPSLAATTAFAQKEGAQKIALFGFCWGAKMAWHAAQDGSTYAAAAFIHPSFFTPDDAKFLQVPIINLPTKDEPDMVPYMEALKEASPALHEKSEHKRFDDVHHGFCAARGDWSDELQAQRANEAIKLVANFYKKQF